MNPTNYNENLFTLLTSHPWDSGTGRKMLFLTRRYYIFDDEHKLLDGGVIRYNKTLQKIFIRNEDLRGEVFLRLEGEDKIHLQGSVSSKLAGQISIDNSLTRYEKHLKAPLSRVAKVERYLSAKDIYEILLSKKEIDESFLQTYEKSLHSFSSDQARILYIKISPSYFKDFQTRTLKTISLYFSGTPSNDKLYEELFMFLMGIHAAYENDFIKTYDINTFITSIQTRLLESYDNRPPSIPISMINEALLYFHIDSPHLPNVKQCITRLYDKSLQVQEEHAHYLSLMGDKVKAVEDDIFKRLVEFYQEKFFAFQQKIYGEKPTEQKMKKVVTELTTQLALIQALGNCKSDNKEIHLFLLFLLSNNEKRVKEVAKQAFMPIQDKVLRTFKHLNIESLKLL